MKKYVSDGWLTSVNVGAIFLAAFGFGMTASAGIIVGNLGQTTVGSYNANVYIEETFTPSQNTTLGSVTLNLNYSAAASGTVNLYELTGGLTLVGGLGTVSSSSSGTANDTIGGLSAVLVSGNEYIVQLVSTTSDITWNYTSGNSTASGSTGAFDTLFYNRASNSDHSDTFKMELDAVPEIPQTGLVMGLGALAICGLDRLRRNRPAAPLPAALARP